MVSSKSVVVRMRVERYRRRGRAKKRWIVGVKEDVAIDSKAFNCKVSSDKVILGNKTYGADHK